MTKKLTGVFLVLLGLFATGTAAVAAPPPSGSTDPVGNDVSWPQCGKTLPVSPAFAIVGVTGGLANNTNPCLAEQLAWAGKSSTGGSSQPKVALYVNTANPGHAGSWWPSSNTYANVSVSNPYGTCGSGGGAPGPVDLPCSYMYGYAKAYDDATIRGVTNPGTYFWWLDVETGNSWQTGGPDSTALNRATLEGMATYFKGITAGKTDSAGKTAGVGIYSTGSQWGTIAGTVQPGSPLAGLHSWLAGAKTLRGAKSNCSLPGLTPGSSVTVTQYVAAGLDYDYACR
ncbi:hypothetical protein OVA06_12795 [Pseudarthrobacter sp. SL88]|uniref:hypothetical protein n=1 Tax=Pseudarthrobacter sp. SL88 TaxID=2994666 RepID=UPI002275AD73|nr:hypothetical protein [Pseudarthrobacter sp. SL88]MCY1675573.1 hypothetical protein [Pseudarthrobacter sp. SL88]